MAELGIFGTLVSNLNAMGFYGFMLPWLLVFAVIYGLLIKSKILGEGKGPSGIVALVLAFFITAYSGIGNYFIALSGLGGMLIGALLVIALFFAMIGFDPSKLADVFGKKEFAALIVALALVIFFTVGGGAMSGISLSGESLAVVFMIVVVALAVLFVTK